MYENAGRPNDIEGSAGRFGDYFVPNDDEKSPSADGFTPSNGASPRSGRRRRPRIQADIDGPRRFENQTIAKFAKPNFGDRLFISRPRSRPNDPETLNVAAYSTRTSRSARPVLPVAGLCAVTVRR
jgi:hypothetical protein